jgi:hypothetical protein
MTILGISVVVLSVAGYPAAVVAAVVTVTCVALSGALAMVVSPWSMMPLKTRAMALVREFREQRVRRREGLVEGSRVVLGGSTE